MNVPRFVWKISPPSINGDLRVRPRSGGRFEIEMEGDDHPSWQVLLPRHENGSLRNLIQEDEI